MSSPTRPQRGVIVHGYGATPADHWFGWISEELRQRGIPTQVPALPRPDAPEPMQVDAILSSSIGRPDEGTVIVAHSLGAVATLRHLASLRPGWRLGRLVIVAGFADPLPGLPELKGFLIPTNLIAPLAIRITRLRVLRSDDDPVVPAEHTDRLADLLHTSSVVAQGRGHFLADEGVTSLPELLPGQVLPR